MPGLVLLKMKKKKEAFLVFLVVASSLCDKLHWAKAPPQEASTCCILNPFLNFSGFAWRQKVLDGATSMVGSATSVVGSATTCEGAAGGALSLSEHSPDLPARVSPAYLMELRGRCCDRQGVASQEKHLCCKQKFARFCEGADFHLESVKRGPDLGSERFRGVFCSGASRPVQEIFLLSEHSSVLSPFGKETQPESPSCCCALADKSAEIIS